MHGFSLYTNFIRRPHLNGNNFYISFYPLTIMDYIICTFVCVWVLDGGGQRPSGQFCKLAAIGSALKRQLKASPPLGHLHFCSALFCLINIRFESGKLRFHLWPLLIKPLLQLIVLLLIMSCLIFYFIRKCTLLLGSYWHKV